MSIAENIATNASNLEANHSSSRRPSLNQTRNHVHSVSVPSQNSSKSKINRIVSDDLSSSSSLPSAAAISVAFAKDEKKRLSAYEKLLYDSQHDMRFKAEEKAGRRIGFYRIRGDIGLGNFSRVKLGVHLLAKGGSRFFSFLRVRKRFMQKSRISSTNNSFIVFSHRLSSSIPLNQSRLQLMNRKRNSFLFSSHRGKTTACRDSSNVKKVSLLFLPLNTDLETRRVPFFSVTRLAEKTPFVSFAEKVAIKILDKTKLDERTQRLLLREITSMERLHHPNIIRLYEVIETPNEIHIVTEYAAGGELYTRISKEGKFSEAEAKGLFAQIIAAVDHMVKTTTTRRTFVP